MTRRELLARLVAIGATLLGAPRRAVAATPWDELFEVAVSYETGSQNRLARRPYVAVYVERPDGTPVRTVSLWREKHGIPWLRHLRRWHRANVAGRQSGEANRVLAIASATRLPGRYTVVWNGRDDAGQLVEQGPYVLVIECVRQGSTAHLVEGEFAFGATPFSATLESDADIQQVAVEYRRRGAP